MAFFRLALFAIFRFLVPLHGIGRWVCESQGMVPFMDQSFREGRLPIMRTILGKLGCFTSLDDIARMAVRSRRRARLRIAFVMNLQILLIRSTILCINNTHYKLLFRIDAVRRCTGT